jgi:hypothetical protein
MYIYSCGTHGGYRYQLFGVGRLPLPVSMIEYQLFGVGRLPLPVSMIEYQLFWGLRIYAVELETMPHFVRAR